jgi:N-acetylglucosamine-6-phosphate deacetylase
MRLTVTAARLWTADGIVENPLLEIEDGRIASIASRASAEPPDPLAGRGFQSPASILSAFGAQQVVIEGREKIHHFPNATLAPAFLDVHLHGGAGHDVMEATPEALRQIGELLARHGTARYLATTVSAPLDATLKAVCSLAKLIGKADLLAGDKPCAQPVGIHLEGPFLSHAKRGVQPAEHLLPPDIATFDWLYEAAEGHVRLMTIAPELPGAIDLIAHATRRGVRVSLGHSDATAEATLAAIDAGAVNTTHTFNGMRPFDHREPGILGTVLTDDRIYAELICDGIHVSPAAVKLWWRAKGAERAILVTDAISATGMPDGEYQLGGFPVHVANGRAMARGVLAGSVLTLDKAIENFVVFTGATATQAVRLAAANPAAMLGLDAAALTPGAPADFVAIDERGKLISAFVGGRITA